MLQLSQDGFCRFLFLVFVFVCSSYRPPRQYPALLSGRAAQAESPNPNSDRWCLRPFFKTRSSFGVKVI